LNENKALIFDIKKFAIHDGVGIRTTVFFKGCPLNCWWCHNPESLNPKPELVLYENKCIGCGGCFKVCPQKAHEILPNKNRVYHKEKCLLCGKCSGICYAEALVMQGRKVTVEELMVELRKDIPFYKNSDGGITLSGGEPMYQHVFVEALLKQCKSEGLHTIIDTCGYTSWKKFKKVLPYLDSVLYDLKHINDHKHKIYTGVSNRLILRNLYRIGDYGLPLTIRIPIIPGINDTKENIIGAAQFLLGVKNIIKVELLPYHNLAESKYIRLGKEYKLNDLTPPDKEDVNIIAEWISSFGLKVQVGG
jgi:pyruvate formate lyase activating enzyme